MGWRNVFNLFKLREKYTIPDNIDTLTDVPNKRHSLYAIKTDTKKNINQDAFEVFQHAESGTIIMALADGIGSSFFAEEGSKFVVEKAVDILKEEFQEGREIDYVDIFKRIQSGLTEMVKEKYYDQLTDINDHDFGTTLIVGIDSPDVFTLAYIGNGCAYYIQGDITYFPNVNYMPWGVNDLLTPHSLPNEVTGKDELCKYFCYRPTNVDQVVPTVITISKNHYAGEIFVLATDGLDSADKHDEFYYQDDNLYTKSSWSMSLFCRAIKDYLKTTSKIDDEGLSMVLDDYFNTLERENRMDDDTTIGIIVTSKVNRQLT